MVAVHTLAVFPSVKALNEAVGRAFLARLRTLIDEAGDTGRINVAISGGAVTTSLLPSLLPLVNQVDWSRVRVWLVDECAQTSKERSAHGLVQFLDGRVDLKRVDSHHRHSPSEHAASRGSSFVRSSP